MRFCLLNNQLTKECGRMVTAIYSLSQVRGAELLLLFWFGCAVVYLLFSLTFTYNRTNKGIRNVFIGLLIAEVVIDLTLAITYYDNCTYQNHGLGGVFGVLLWIPVLVVTLIIITAINMK